MRRSYLLVLPMLMLLVPGWVTAEETFQAESLEIVRCTTGEVSPQNLVDFALAPAGQFEDDAILWWRGSDKPGGILEVRIPGLTPGRYRTKIHLVKAADYAIVQFMVNGQNAGQPLDLYAAMPQGTVHEMMLEPGIINVTSEHLLLGAKLIGTNPKTLNGYGVGIDYVALERVEDAEVPTPTPEPEPTPEPTTTPVPPPAPTLDYIGGWRDLERGHFTVISADGTWSMMNTAVEGKLPRAGCWGRMPNSWVTVRTCLANPSQLWIPGIPEVTARELTQGPYDLTVVWTLRPEGDNKLVGNLRTWRAEWDRSGRITKFLSWDDKGNEPQRVVWVAVPRPVPGAAVQAESRTIIQGIIRAFPPGAGVGGAGFLEWLRDLGQLGETGG